MTNLISQASCYFGVPASFGSSTADLAMFPLDGLGNPTTLLTAAVTSASFVPSILLSSATFFDSQPGVSGGTWIASSRTFRKTNAFIGYTAQAGDYVVFSSAVANPGPHLVDSKTDDSNIVLKTNADLVNRSSVTGTIYSAGGRPVFSVLLTAAFTNYSWRNGDYLAVTGGTGIIQQNVPILSRVDANSIRVANDLGVFASDLAGNIPNQNLVVKSSGFSNYIFHASDVFAATGGTGINTGNYTIESKISADCLRLASSAGVAAADLAGNVAAVTCRANKSHIRDAKLVALLECYSTVPASADEWFVCDMTGTAIPGLAFKGAAAMLKSSPGGIIIPSGFGLVVHSVTAASGTNTPTINAVYKVLQG